MKLYEIDWYLRSLVFAIFSLYLRCAVQALSTLSRFVQLGLRKITINYMKYFFTIFGCFVAVVSAYLNSDISNVDLSNVLEARHFLSRIIKHHHSKRDIYGGQPKLVKRTRKKKAASRGSQGKATGKNSNPQQVKEKDPNPSPSPEKPIPEPPIRAEVNIRGPADIHTVRGPELQEGLVPSGERRRRVVTHPALAAAGGKRLVNPPANAESQHHSQHGIEAWSQGAVAETTLRIPEGGKGRVSFEVPGRPRGSYELYGAPNTVHGRPPANLISAESNSDEPAKLHSSATDGSFIEAAGFPRSHIRLI